MSAINKVTAQFYEGDYQYTDKLVIDGDVENFVKEKFNRQWLYRKTKQNLWCEVVSSDGKLVRYNFAGIDKIEKILESIAFIPVFESTREAFLAMNELKPEDNYYPFALSVIESEKRGLISRQQSDWIIEELKQFEALQSMTSYPKLSI